jgi:lambda family phage portal protein
MDTPKAPLLERALMTVAPGMALKRLRARAAAQLLLRHFDAASTGRRTENWSRRGTDANTAAGASLGSLRYLARDLVRNNGWARNAVRVITRNTVGCGIVAKPASPVPAEVSAAWKTWAGTTQCDADGRLTFYGLQKLVMRAAVESGEALVRPRWRRLEDGYVVPFQLQVLEPDFLDSTQDGRVGQEGGPIIQGIEHDAIGRRVAYWLFSHHPGSSFSAGASKRVPASDILHIYDQERAGQVRGPSWLAAAIVKLRDFDEFEDAQIMKQKIAACFAAFRTDTTGEGTPIGLPQPPEAASSPGAPPVDTLEPGMVKSLPPGEEITFGNPPMTTDDGFSVRTLRAIAAAMGVTYEDLTGDYSQVNFSSARMSRLAHWGNVYDWQWNILIPQLCDPVWAWFMRAAAVAGLFGSEVVRPGAEWTPQPMQLIEPDREARANLLMMRSGQKTLSMVLREMGLDPATHLAEYAADMATLDRLKIKLDMDVRAVSQAGLTQMRAGGKSETAPAAVDEAGDGAEKDPSEDPSSEDAPAAA